MKYGVAWYPEHWEQSRWSTDLSLMQKAGMNLVRLAESAWSQLEPTEGTFDFDWLEQAISAATAHGFEVVLGTPTYAPPAWLTTQYPEVLAVNASGRTATHGYRCHYAVASPVYRAKAQGIALAMAKRFGKDSRILGWQVDNEYKSVSYDPETKRQFHAWLEERYKTIDQLNKRWTTIYWSQRYELFSQIPLPIDDVPFPDGFHNPCLRLEWKRFITFLYARYQHEQIEALKTYIAPEQWITHNFMGWFDKYDPQELARELDFVSWDNYFPTGELDHLENGAMHDAMRGLKQKNFWVMETQVGAVNWAPINGAMERGAMRRMCWHAVGHGADAVLYWQWRQALGGQEQYHCSVLGSDGLPKPNFAEIAQIGKEFELAKTMLENTGVKASVALLHSYDDHWSLSQQPHHKDFDAVKNLRSYYRPLRENNVEVDIVHPTAQLEQYALVIAPSLHLLTPELTKHLTEYVKAGGHLVLGPRSGFKNTDNALLESKQPGLLGGLFGVQVEDYYALAKPVSVSGEIGAGQAQIWGEWLTPSDPQTEVILRYGPEQSWLADQAAMVTRVIGTGRATQIGFCGNEALINAVLPWLLKQSQVQGLLPRVLDVEVCRRVFGDTEVLIIINHGSESRIISLPREMTDILTQKIHSGSVELAANDVMVLKNSF
jgi:beta-galactosidase